MGHHDSKTNRKSSELQVGSHYYDGFYGASWIPYVSVSLGRTDDKMVLNI